MTDLTEQWKKGELPDGEYWCLSICDDIDKLYCYQNSFWKYKTEDDYYGVPVEIKQVLAPVPSYDEWEASEKYNKHLEEVIKIYERKDKQATETSIAYNELAEENDKLKDLLNEAFKYVHQDCLKNLRVGYTPTSCLLVRDIIEVLKDYRRKNASEVLYVEEKKDD